MIALMFLVWLNVATIPQAQKDVSTLATLSLKQVSANSYELRIQNKTNKSIAVCKWPWRYEIRVTDSNHRKLSDLYGYLSRVSIIDGPKAEWNWVVLHEGEGIIIPLHAYDQHGKMRLTRDAKFADCLTTYPTYDKLIVPPDFVKRAKVKVVLQMSSSPRIVLNKPSESDSDVKRFN